MFFPTAGIEVQPWLPPLIAMGISFFTSMGGVSGAFLLLPFQMSVLGYTHPSVSATNQLFNIVAIPGGVWRYCKEGRMVWPLAVIVIAGTLPGVFIGAFIRLAYLPDPQSFKCFAAGVLLYIGIKMVGDLLQTKPLNILSASGRKRAGSSVAPFRKQTVKPGSGSQTATASISVTHFSLNRLTYVYQGKSHRVSCPGIFALSFIVGIVGGVYGIGGGSIVAPFFVTCFGLPVHTVAGAALMGTFVTSVAGVIFYQAMAPLYPGMSVAPDWALGILFGIGGMAGMYMGARCQKFVSPRLIKWMLAIIIISTALKYALASWF